MEVPMFDPQKYYLGALCKRGHRWQDTEQSLRHRVGRNCIECKRDDQKHRATTPEGKASRQARNERYRRSERGKAHFAAYNSDPELAPMRAARQLRYRQTENGKATRKKAEVKYMRTEGRRISWKRKYTKRKMLIAENREFYGKREINALFARFNDACAYCGSQENLTLDHFVPLNCGGFDAIWNIVPACFSCNSSKQDDHAWTWYRSKPFYSEQRWQFILDIMVNNG
jgi:5-methylcytosine-specific restriction endonuclease McrA